MCIVLDFVNLRALEKYGIHESWLAPQPDHLDGKTCLCVS